ncbi:MAG TPA: hypothetical protein VKS19_05935, partial [Verrucomicrobiae bacterium]|nr:hypothetical protein [Verrucomicrobiae bacterium]
MGATPLLVAVYGHAQCFGIDYYWTNSLGGNWNNAANWFPNGVPGGNACDTATIGFPGTYTVVLNSSNVTIYALTIGFMSGTHTLVITNSGSLTVTGGAFVDTNGILDLSGGVLDQGTNSVVAGVFNWAGGTLGGAGPVTVVTNGLLQILTASSNLLGTTVLNYGTTTWTNSTANLYFSRQLPAAVFVNEPGGVFENRNGPAMTFAGGLTTPPASAGFYNNGLFRKVGGNGTSTRIQVPFSNGGTILPLRGNLAFNNILTLAASSVLQFPISGIQPGTNFGTITVAPASSVLAALGMPGSVQWAGTLIVGPTNGFQPALGNTFSLMTFGMKESGFDTGFLAGL